MSIEASLNCFPAPVPALAAQLARQNFLAVARSLVAWLATQPVAIGRKLPRLGVVRKRQIQAFLYDTSAKGLVEDGKTCFYPAERFRDIQSALAA